MLHFTPSSGRMLNDPNGPCFWKGRYHLFFQHLVGDAWAWGHAVSTDLLHWEELPDAILPVCRENESEYGRSGAASCWSGSAWVSEEKVAAVFYGHAGRCGLYVMEASDELLMEWHNVTDGPAIPSVDCPNEGDDPAQTPVPYISVPYTQMPMLYDPCIWREEGKWYILSGGIQRDPYTDGMRRQEYLYESENLIHWDYLHPMVTEKSFGDINDDGACPYFVPWEQKPGERLGEDRLLLHFSHQYGPRYVMGHYDREQKLFTPYSGARINRLSSQDGYHAPACIADPDHNGAILAWYVMHGRGVRSVMSLTHRLTRCGEHGEQLQAMPAFDIDMLSAEKKALSSPDGKWELPETCAIRIKIGYGEDAWPALVLSNRIGKTVAVLRLHAHCASSKMRARKWTQDDLAILSTFDRPDPAPPQVVELPHTDGHWELTLIRDADVLEIFFPGSLSLPRRLYGDLEGLSLSLENAESAEGVLDELN